MNNNDDLKISSGADNTALGQQSKGKGGCDPQPDTPMAAAAARPEIRMSRKQLLDLEPTLDELDWQILQTIRRCRVILGQQIGRLYFYKVEGKRAQVNATNRKLRSLVKRGLIAAVNQKINVRMKGYTAYIYYLTEPGERILQIHLNEPEYRKRNIEPTMATLVHSISVVETAVQAIEACRADDMKLVELQLEPACWRPYEHLLKPFTLKPDLALVTEKQDWSLHEEPWYELRWFVEVDLSTENIQTILDKCRRYYDYYKSDLEQKEHDDVFPLVVFLVKDDVRKATLVRHIRETFEHCPRLFAVVRADEFTKLLRDELEVTDCICPL